MSAIVVEEFIASLDVVVIGRKTFETVLTLSPWAYGDKRVVVLSSNPIALSAAGRVVEQMAGPGRTSRVEIDPARNAEARPRGYNRLT